MNFDHFLKINFDAILYSVIFAPSLYLSMFVLLTDFSSFACKCCHSCFYYTKSRSFLLPVSQRFLTDNSNVSITFRCKAMWVM